MCTYLGNNFPVLIARPLAKLEQLYNVFTPILLLTGDPPLSSELRALAQASKTCSLGVKKIYVSIPYVLQITKMVIFRILFTTLFIIYL